MDLSALVSSTPSGFREPLLTVSPENHTAWIVIAVGIGVPWILTFGGIRLFVRWKGRAGYDDIALGIATILAFLQICLVFDACNYGLGKSTRLLTAPHQLEQVQKLYYASNFVYILTIGASKASVALLLLRLTTVYRHKFAFYVVLIIVVLWTIISLFLVGLQCDLTQAWRTVDSHCLNMQVRWDFIGAVDIAIECFFTSLSAYLIWDLNTALSKKCAVIVAFASRLPLIVIVVIRLVTFDEKRYTTDPTLAETNFIIWSQVQITYSLVSATVPSMRPFLSGLNSLYGGGIRSTYGDSSYAHEMSELRSPSKLSRSSKAISSRNSRSTATQSFAHTGGNRTIDGSIAGSQSQGSKTLLPVFQDPDRIFEGFIPGAHEVTVSSDPHAHREFDDDHSFASHSSQQQILITKSTTISIGTKDHETLRPLHVSSIGRSNYSDEILPIQGTPSPYLHGLSHPRHPSAPTTSTASTRSTMRMLREEAYSPHALREDRGKGKGQSVRGRSWLDI